MAAQRCRVAEAWHGFAPEASGRGFCHVTVRAWTPCAGPPIAVPCPHGKT